MPLLVVALIRATCLLRPMPSRCVVWQSWGLNWRQDKMVNGMTLSVLHGVELLPCGAQRPPSVPEVYEQSGTSALGFLSTLSTLAAPGIYPLWNETQSVVRHEAEMSLGAMLAPRNLTPNIK